MFERFTDRARRVLVIAQEESREFNHAFIGTEHILLGLIRENDGLAARALSDLGITFEAVWSKVDEAVGASLNPSPGSPPFTPRAKKVLELSLREALQLGHSYIGTEHLLLGIVREGDGVGVQVLHQLGADRDAVRQKTLELMSLPEGALASSELSEEQLGINMLNQVVRRIGRQLRPDLDPAEIDSRALGISQDLYEQIQVSWADIPGPPE